MSSPEEIVRQRALAKQREEEDARHHQYQKALTEARILIPRVVEALKKLQYPDDSIFIRNTSLQVSGATRVAWRLHDGSRVNESRLVCCHGSCVTSLRTASSSRKTTITHSSCPSKL